MQQTMYPAIANSPQTELAAAIDDVQDTIELVDASKLPAAPNLAVLGSDETAETVLYTGVDGNTLTGVTRGFQGIAKAWSAGTKVARNFTAYDWDSARQNIEDHETRLGDAESGITDLQADVSTVQTDLATHESNYTAHIPYATATGSANAYEVTLNPAPTAYVEGMALSVKINADNTGAATINVNGLGAKPIKKPNGSDVSAGGLKAGGVYTLRYNGSAFILQGEGGVEIPASDIRAGAVYDGVVGTYTSDATATAADIQQGLTAYVNGQKLTGTSTRKRWATGTINGAADTKNSFNITGLTFPPGFVAYYTNAVGNIVFGMAKINGDINANKASNGSNNIEGDWTSSANIGYSPSVEFGSSFVNGLYKPGNQVTSIKWFVVEGSF